MTTESTIGEGDKHVHDFTAEAGIQGTETSASSNDFLEYIFVTQLLRQAPWQIGRAISLQCSGDHERKVANIHAIQDMTVHNEVANWVFGDKLAGDLGIRSTQDHPKTDFGEPRFCGSWDLDEK